MKALLAAAAAVAALLMLGGGAGFKMGRSLKFDQAAHNRLWLTVAHSMGHHLETFGKPELCAGGLLNLA